MAVNDLTFEQISTLLNGFISQATGKTPISAANTSDFVTIGQTALKTAYDPLLTAMSQVLSRTIFSSREYDPKFKGLIVNNQRWGNHVRKVTYTDKPFENDQRFELVDGQSVDHYNVKKPSVLQTNFYGANIFQDHVTIYQDQLDSAMTGPEMFGEFLAFVMTEHRNKLESARETLARYSLANLIGGKLALAAAAPAEEDNHVIHLLTEYNALTGLSLTATSVYQPGNFESFMKWVYSRVSTVTALMTERTYKFHVNITDKPVLRHTPLTDQKVYLYAPAQFQISSQVIADVYHDSYLRYADHEVVNFWQSVDSPDTINVTPSYIDSTGVIVTAEEPVVKSNIFGVVFDQEAAGITYVNQRTNVTPVNAAGNYHNIYWHETQRYWNDFTENAMVLLLD